MHGRAPEGVRVRPAPDGVGRENCSHTPADAGFAPAAVVVFVHRTDRAEPARNGHPRHRHALSRRRPAVVAEQKIEILSIASQNHREVAVPAGKIAVLRSAIDGMPLERPIPKSKNCSPPVVRDQSAGFRSSECHLAAHPRRFVVIPGEDGAIGVSQVDSIRYGTCEIAADTKCD
jgi:hypothetical protein